MVEYNKINVKLSVTQLKKLKTVAKNKTGTTLRIRLKMVNGNNLPHELLLATRQKTKVRNAFNNMSTHLKLSQAHISKIIQSARFLRSLLSKLAGPLMKIAVPLAKMFLPHYELQLLLRQLMLEFKKKKHGSGNITLIISNEEMNDITKIIQALENSNILLKGVNNKK